jgi:hypothetical protein
MGSTVNKGNAGASATVAHATLRPKSTAEMPARHTMSQTMRCSRRCGSTPIHKAAHGRRRAASNQGGPSTQLQPFRASEGKTQSYSEIAATKALVPRSWPLYVGSCLHKEGATVITGATVVAPCQS